MVRAIGALVGSAVVVLAVACGGGSPTSDCDQAVSVFCNKFFQCAQTQADQTFGTESGCEAKEQLTFNCANQVCPSGTTYDNTDVEACINAYNADCSTINTTPAACQNITYCK